jgi:hypothetical protein
MKSLVSVKSVACLLVAGVVSLGMAPSRAHAAVFQPGALGVFSPSNPLGLRAGCRYEVYAVRLVAGTTYQIDLRSSDFDAYLILANDARLFLTSDDDSGGNLNARIVWRAEYTGTHYIYATTFAPGAGGRFTLTVRP